MSEHIRYVCLDKQTYPGRIRYTQTWRRSTNYRGSSRFVECTHKYYKRDSRTTYTVKLYSAGYSW